MKSRILIVDDEPFARKLLAGYANRLEALHLVAECGSALEAAQYLRTQRVDLVFLDIQMPELTGLQWAATLVNPPALILTTAYREFAPEAYELEVVDYLLKPISFERFLKSVNKFFDRAQAAGLPTPSESTASATHVYIKAERKLHKVPVEEIAWIESLDDYVKIFLPQQVLITRENISSLASRLPESFVRIHRSFVVNSQLVRSFSAEGVTIQGKELPFGRAFKKNALAQLSNTQ